jgi:CrcB protein
MMNLLAIFLGGGLGATARFLLSRFVSQHAFTPIPLGTFLENALGATSKLLLRAVRKIDGSRLPRSFIIIGFIGGFTTFSTYALETILLIQRRDFLPAGLKTSPPQRHGLHAVVAASWPPTPSMPP